MSNPLSYNIESDENSNTVFFCGNLNEEASFPKPEELANKKYLVLDLDEINFINSLGIRDWTRWMKELSANEITLKYCTPSFVQTMNIISGFLPENAVVESFYAPYFCEDCEKEYVKILQRGKDYQEKTSDDAFKISVTEEEQCPHCGGIGELDVLKEKYFSFLKK